MTSLPERASGRRPERAESPPASTRVGGVDTIDEEVRHARVMRRTASTSRSRGAPTGPARDQQSDAMLFRAAPADGPTCSAPPGSCGLQREAGNGAVSDLVEEERSPVLDVVSSGPVAARRAGAH